MTYEKVLNFLLPHYCVLCNTLTHRDIDICANCEAELPKITCACKCCGQALFSNQEFCGSCLQNPPPFHRTIAMYHYQSPIDYLIQTIKFCNNLLYANVLGRLLAQEVGHYYHNSAFPEALIPVPLHLERLRERGYNQAVELARPVEKILQIPIDQYCCSRIKDTQAQATLEAKNRAANIRHAFKCKKHLRYKHVAVIDDVMTTGSTMSEFCQTLRNSGVKKIDVWVVARANFKSGAFV